MNPVPMQANTAGQRLLLINGVTWAVIVGFFGYGVFNPPPLPPLPYTGRAPADAAAGFARVPQPPGPVSTSPAKDGSPQPAVTLNGMAAASPRMGLAPTKTDPDQPAPAKDGAPRKADPQKPGTDEAEKPPQKARIGGFAPAGPPRGSQ